MTLKLSAPFLAVLLLVAPASWARDTAAADIRRNATVNAIEQVLPCVVNIATETVVEYHDPYEDLWRQFYGAGRVPVRQQKSISLGSGVIIDEDGYLLTNFHVISRASRVQVKLWDGREYDAEPLVSRPGSDVSLCRIKAKPGEKFKAIKFAPDDDLLLGETVLALGNPFGLGGSVTKGILSSKNRRPSNGNEKLGVEDWLETDATINPGNSGGPLVNLRGELIGLNVAVARESEGMGMGFSIPVKQVSTALSRFFTPEWTDSLWFGAVFKAGPGPLKATIVQLNSPAAKAGLCEGDQVIEVNGQAPAGLIACNRLLAANASHEAKLVVQRDGARRTLTAHLLPLDEFIRQRLGLTVLELTSQNAERLGVQANGNLFVKEVEKDGPADHAKVQGGCLLAGVGGQASPDLQTLAGMLFEAKKGDSVQLIIVGRRRLGARYVEYRQPVEVTVR